MAFSVITYNILADAYLRPEWFAGVPAEVLDPANRWPALAAHLTSFDSDILCLQEVQPDVFQLFDERLSSQGYVGHYAQKGRGRPDGCATFVRASRFDILGGEALHYADGGGRRGDSGHVALICHLAGEDGPVAVANTHLRWDPPGEPDDERWAIAEMGELLSRRGAHPESAWIFCGDFNVEPQDSLVRLLEGSDMNYAYRGREDQTTCCANGRTQKLDYLFYTPDLAAEPMPVASLEAITLLPSEHHPSDHIVVGAVFRKVSRS